jgi:glyoxylase I family protein
MKNRNTISEDKRIKHSNHAGRIFLEHVALNVENPVGMASWYCENLGMNIVIKGPAPANTHFISDASGCIMLEVYNNPPDAVPDYDSMNPLSLHIAFMVDDVEEICRKLTSAGATIVDDVSTTANGDIISMLRDPWGIPIQFVKRAKPMLSK